MRNKRIAKLNESSKSDRIHCKNLTNVSDVENSTPSTNHAQDANNIAEMLNKQTEVKLMNNPIFQSMMQRFFENQMNKQNDTAIKDSQR